MTCVGWSPGAAKCGSGELNLIREPARRAADRNPPTAAGSYWQKSVPETESRRSEARCQQTSVEDGRRMVEGAGWRPAIGRLQELDRLASASRLRGRQGVGQVKNQRRYPMQIQIKREMDCMERVDLF